MDWLIYISGWFWGFVTVNSVIGDSKDPEKDLFWLKAISWTMTWVWICWKFI